MITKKNNNLKAMIKEEIQIFFLTIIIILTFFLTSWKFGKRGDTENVANPTNFRK